MKRVLSLLYLVCLVSPVAFAKQQAVVSDSNESECLNIAKAAEIFMEQKQKGIPFTAAMKIVSDAIKDKDRAEIVMLIVQDAYTRPTYTSKTQNQDQLNAFSVEYYSKCMKMGK